MPLSNSYRMLVTRPFLLFTFILLFKSYLVWLVIFDGVPSWTPLIKEIPFIWILFCFIEWFAAKRKLAIYWGVNLLLTAIFFAVIMYYKYYGVIVTYHALQQVNQVATVKSSVFSLLDPQYLLIFTDVIVLGIWLMSGKRAILWKKLSSTKERRSVVIGLLLISLMVCSLHVFPHRASMNEFTKVEQMGILNYEAYTIFAEEEEPVVEQEEITQEAIRQLKGIREPEQPKYWQMAAGKNVIVIQLESFQNFLIGLKLDGREVTPTINRLAAESFYFPNFYQQVGQGNTSDAEFIVNTSYYIPSRGAATQIYAGKALPSLPKLLKEHGYTSATFHTNDVEFWNRGELYKALGFDRYYDRQYFGDEDTVFFGASDEVLYAKTADELERMNREEKPFYAHIISMSAHHPYTIPEDKYRMTIPERYEGTLVGDYIRAQNYADYALGKFIERLKENGVWEDSLIVIYGDHLGLPKYSLDRQDKEFMEEIFGHEYGYADMLNIPLLIIAPGLTEPAVFEQIGGQVDLLPTIANLLGVSLEDYLHFGQDLLNHTYNLLPQRYYLPSGSLINSQALFLPGTGYEDGTSYPLAGKEAAEDRPAVSKDEYDRALELLHLSDSYVNQLPDRESGQK